MISFLYLAIKNSLGSFWRRYKSFQRHSIFYPNSSYISPAPGIQVSPCLSIGNNTKIIANELADTVLIKENVRINDNCLLIANNGGTIKIARDVLIGPGCVFRASNHRFTAKNEIIANQGHEPGTISIENNVWIGANCSILPNVNIGEGSIVGAGAVVNKDIPPYEIWGGVPAKLIKKR
ncbi:MAG: acyltransferase [Halobacteriovoraceae bacterium]|nr:acyltransferase [Halobacteriovoraceae bacterium]